MGGWNDRGEYVADKRPWWEQLGLPAAGPRYREPCLETIGRERCWRRSSAGYPYICGKAVVDPDLGLCASCLEELREG